MKALIPFTLGERVMDYDIAIHHNPDAQAWAKLFIETTKDMDREVFRDEGYMIVWFANAMMAMYDSMDPQKAANEIVRLQSTIKMQASDISLLRLANSVLRSERNRMKKENRELKGKK